jgi:cyclin-A
MGVLQAFLQRFLRASHIATQVEYKCLEALTRYILELSLLDFSMLSYRPSTVAAATLLLARILLAHMHHQSGPYLPHVVWTRTLEHYTFHTAEELEACTRKLHKTLLAASCKSDNERRTFHSIYTKYEQTRRGAVARLGFMTSLPAHAFEPMAQFWVPAEYFSHLGLAQTGASAAEGAPLSLKAVAVGAR